MLCAKYDYKMDIAVKQVGKKREFHNNRESISSATPSVNSNNSNSKGQLMIGVKLSFVAMIGGDVSIGLLFNLDDSTKFGLFLSGGFAAGTSAGVSVFGEFNISKQHMLVIPFATQEEKNKLMIRYFEHH